MASPDLVIVVGAMKAGTTTIFERLASHPEVFGSEPKEPGFFARDEMWTKGHDWYRDLWPEEADEGVRLEGSTLYTMRPQYPDSIPRMAGYLEKHGLEARLVYSLRDPLERIRSHLTHMRAHGRDERLTMVEEGSLQGHALALSMYAHQLDRILEHFERSRLEIVRFERLAEDTTPVVRELLEALDLDPERLESGKEVHNPTTEQYRKSIAWRASEAVGLDRLTDRLPESLLDRVRGTLGDEIEEKIELNQEQRLAFLRALEGDLRRLRDVHDVDVEDWQLPPGLQ